MEQLSDATSLQHITLQIYDTIFQTADCVQMSELTRSCVTLPSPDQLQSRALNQSTQFYSLSIA